jgi:hypothetical protein
LQGQIIFPPTNIFQTSDVSKKSDVFLQGKGHCIFWSKLPNLPQTQAQAQIAKGFLDIKI